MGRSLRRLTRRRLSSAARGAYVAVFVLAWMAPGQVAALPDSVEITPEIPFVDERISVDSPSRVDVVFGGGLSCVEFSAVWPAALDAYLRVFDSSGAVIAEDDDGAFDPDTNCYAARVSFDAIPGTYIVRFTRYGTTHGLGFVSWGSTNLTPEPETTNVTTSSSTTSSSSTTTEPSPESTTTSEPEPTSTEPSPSSTSLTGGEPTSTLSDSSLPETTTTAVESGAVSTVAGTSVPPSTTLTIPSTTATSTTTTETSVDSTTTSSLPSPSVTTTVATSSVAEPVTTSVPAPTTTQSSTSSTTTSTTPSPSTTLPPSTVPSPSSTQPAPTVTTTTLPDVTGGLVDGDVTADDVAALSEIDIATLAPDVVAALVEALNDADDEVREAFEEQVDVFSGLVDSYVPVGSNVTVAERRTIVAVTAAIASPLSPLSAARRNKV